MPKDHTLYSVSNLNERIRTLLESSLSDVWVKGEISNFHYHQSSGHMYFTLKDDKGEIRCAMFRNQNRYIKFKPDNGMEIKVFGLVTFYAQRGQVQLKVSLMEPEGQGDLHRKFELLKQSLKEEGLFNPLHKVSIPKYPTKVGVVTSGSSAAFNDIIKVLHRRAPHVEIVLRSVIVQGNDAPADIAHGIDMMDKYGRVDALIIGRGGGSIEDLWAFNEEVVARSIFKAKTPTISAVGHETDFTISDFVADVRAPTPSSGAELASTSLEDILNSLKEVGGKINSSFQRILERGYVGLDHLENRISIQDPSKKIKIKFDTLLQLKQRILRSMNVTKNEYDGSITALEKRLIALGPSQVLDRGYSIAYTDLGEIIRQAEDIKIGAPFILKTKKGSMGASKTSDIQNN
jgi:exodeoxyribonuclease VII large subunit